MGLWTEPYHVVIEIENDECRVLKSLRSLEAGRFDIIDIRGVRGGSTRHLVELSPGLAREIMRSASGGRLRNESPIWIESEGCDFCNTLLSHGSFLISGRRIHDSIFVYSFIVPNFDAYRSILSALRSRDFRPRILRIKKFEPRGKVLTEKQERVLWLALKVGFFDYPRKVNIAELSRRLGVSPSTLSEILRRGMRRILEHYFGST